MNKFNYKFSKLCESFSVLKSPNFLLSNCIEKIKKIQKDHYVNFLHSYDFNVDGSVTTHGYINVKWFKDTLGIELIKDGKFVVDFDISWGTFDCSECELVTLENCLWIIYF